MWIFWFGLSVSVVLYSLVVLVWLLGVTHWVDPSWDPLDGGFVHYAPTIYDRLKAGLIIGIGACFAFLPILLRRWKSLVWPVEILCCVGLLSLFLDAWHSGRSFLGAVMFIVLFFGYPLVTIAALQYKEKWNAMQTGNVSPITGEVESHAHN